MKGDMRYMKKSVYLGQQNVVDWVYSEKTKEELAARYEFVCGGRVLSKEMLAEAPESASEAEYLFSTWAMPVFTEDEVRRYFPKAEAVFYAAGSVQDFAREFLNQGIKVFSAWAANGVPVAEYTLAQIILANTGYYRRLHTPGSGPLWDNRPDIYGLPGNYDATVGIIGAGMIGKMVIERIRAVLEHINILVFDPFLPEEKAKELGVTLCDLPTLFSGSDVISNHLANNPQTVGMLNYDLFSLMKPCATFINTGRGAQVVENDLIKALTEVPTRAAVLDVTEPEPPADDSPFYNMKNVFLSPHVAGSLGNEVHRMAEYMSEESRRFENGLPTDYEVTLKMLETMA